jgi:hypothetical protein
VSEKEKYDVFLSYSDEDRCWASEFAAALTDAGVRNWFDVHDLLPGDRWQDRLEDALRESRTLVFILGPESAESPWMFFELGAALADRKRIIPVLSGKLPPNRIPQVLRRFRFLEEPSATEAGKRVAEVLKTKNGSESD